MEDPLYPVTIKVGGSGQSYAFTALPSRIHANQSFVLPATITKADDSAYDLSSATATMYVSGWKNEIATTTLVTGVIVSNTITFTVPKDLIPESLGGLPLRKPGNSVFFFIIEDTDTVLQFFQQVNVIDTNYTLSGDVDSSPNVITPDKNDIGTVINVNVNTPAVGPAFGDAYIIGTSPTGDWVGQNNDLTVFNGSSWVFYDTLEGNFVFDATSSQQQIFNGTTWGPTAAITYSDSESINDNNGNELITFGVVASAVNELKITNAATGNGPILSALGETNSDLNVNGAGTGKVALRDGSDNTKRALFDVSAITTATDRTITVPDANVDLSNVSSALQNIVEDTTPQLGGNLDANDKNINSILGLGAKSSTTLTIATGAVTQTQLVHAIANESAAATDDLDSVVPATGQTLLLLTMSASGQVPTIKHATGTNTFLLANDTDLTMVMNTVYLFSHDGTNWKLIGSSATGGVGASETVYIKDSQAYNTAGGTAASSATQVRTLNTTEGDTSLVALASNRFKPTANDYNIYAESVYQATDQTFLILYNYTQSSNVIVGISQYNSTGTVATHCSLEGEFTADGVDEYEILMYTTNGFATTGLGKQHNVSGYNNIYTQVELRKK